MRHLWLISAILLVPSLSHAAPLPAGTKAVAASDLKTLLGGKSETAVTGAAFVSAYFAADGSLKAVAFNNTATATGKWTTDAGRVCLDATYVTIADRIAKTPGFHLVQCFDYQEGSGNTYRRFAADGSKPADLKATDWIAFKTAKPDSKDIANNLAAGDKTVDSFAAVAALATKSPGDSPKYGQRLAGEAVKSTMIGHTTTAQIASGTRTITVTPEGKTTIARAGQDPVTGVSRVIGDLYCIQAPMSGPERCFYIYKNGDTYSYVYPDMALNSNFTVK